MTNSNFDSLFTRNAPLVAAQAPLRAPHLTLRFEAVSGPQPQPSQSFALQKERRETTNTNFDNQFTLDALMVPSLTG